MNEPEANSEELGREIREVMRKLDNLKKLKRIRAEQERKKSSGERAIYNEQNREHDRRRREERREAAKRARLEGVPERSCLRCQVTIRKNLEFGLCYRCAAFLSNAPLRPLPRAATNTTPGSEAKVRVLEERYLRGEHLWHPDDLVLDIS